jgi:hypothetical protein
MGDILNTTNTIISIIVGCITIIGSIAGILGKKGAALRRSQHESPQVQAAIQEKWSGFSLIWRIWLGVFFGIIFTVIGTVVADGLINIFYALYISSTQHIVSPPDFSNSTVFIIAAIFGVSFGITGAVNAAAGREGVYVYRQ